VNINLPDISDKVYRNADLSAYPWKKRVMIRAAAWVFYWLIRSIGKTIRFEAHGWDNSEKFNTCGKAPICVAWHDRIFLSTYVLRDRGVVALASPSFDGEYIARFMQHLGFGIARGSSTRGGVKGLVEMIRAAERGLPTAITIDGPKGPRYVAKNGVTLLAKKTGSPMLIFSVEAKSYWTVNSWDKMQIPKPFAKAAVLIADPIYVPANANADVMQEKLAEVQAALDKLVEDGKKWRLGEK
jgi:lysophospholipid acyltransferase (LPLAT)-like uncharacterized protein